MTAKPITKEQAWDTISAQVDQVKSTLAALGIGRFDFSLSRQEAGGFQVSWAQTGAGGEAFEAALSKRQANGPMLIFASGAALDASYSWDVVDTEYSLREAIETVLVNLSGFAASTSGLSSVASVEVFGSTSDGGFPSVLLLGRPINCGWNPPEFAQQTAAQITAHARSDDGVVEVIIDAQPFLRQAEKEEIQGLIDCGWRGDYAADEIYHRACSAGCAEAKKLEAYLGLGPKMLNGDDVGFEVSVDEEEVRAWISAHRPELAAIGFGSADSPSP